MQDTAAVWMLSSSSRGGSPLLVTLMQTAGSLPFFLLALPAGALADVADRRQFLLVAQGWRLLVALALAAAVWSSQASAAVLLAGTLAMSLGATFTLPGWQAIFPEVVEPDDTTAALNLVSVIANLTRGVAPALAGFLLAASGPRVVFTLDAVAMAGVFLTLARWHREPRPQGLPTERFVGAMKAALRYVFHAPAIKTVLVRNAAFVLTASAPVALLPVLVRQQLQLPAATFGVLMAVFGAGGVLTSSYVLPKICSRYSIDRVIILVTIAGAAATVALTLTADPVLLGVALFALGAAWMTALACLNVAAQLVVPDWVRGRASSVYLFIVQGSVAVGGLVWGLLANHEGTPFALRVAAAGLAASLVFARWMPMPQLARMNLSASHHWPAFNLVTTIRPDDGPVMVSISYQIDPARAAEFVTAMVPVRNIRLRDGGMRWILLDDLERPGHYSESFLVESWSEHLRQGERATLDDLAIEERVTAFHVLNTVPGRHHYLVTRPIHPTRFRLRWWSTAARRAG